MMPMILCPITGRYPCPEHTACPPLSYILVYRYSWASRNILDRRKPDQRKGDRRA